jgi:hypothetical protein
MIFYDAVSSSEYNQGVWQGTAFLLNFLCLYAQSYSRMENGNISWNNMYFMYLFVAYLMVLPDMVDSCKYTE